MGVGWAQDGFPVMWRAGGWFTLSRYVSPLRSVVRENWIWYFGGLVGSFAHCGWEWKGVGVGKCKIDGNLIKIVDRFSELCAIMAVLCSQVAHHCPATVCLRRDLSLILS